jgi:trk system potassium uptake protein TrkA
MRVIIIGAGEVGYQLTKYLSQEKLEVVVVEKDQAKLGRMGDELDVATIVADGVSPSVLEEAGAASADMLVAVTDSDEVNMIYCMLAKAMFNIPRKIARIRNPEYYRNEKLLDKNNLDIDPAICPEVEVGQDIIRLLETPFATDVEDFEDGLVKVIGFRVPDDSPLDGRILKSIPPKKFLIGLIEREEKVLVPSGDDKVKRDDVIYMPVKKWEIGDAIAFLEADAKPAKKIMIVGGGRIGYYIASEMEAKADIKLIETDVERCKFLSQSLRKSIVLHGDGSDEKLLNEENIADMDVFVTLTNNEELNIMASMLAKKLGVRKTITLVNRTDYLHLARGLGLKTVLTPRIITASRILKYIRRGDILSLTALIEDRAEIIEARIGSGSKLIGKSLANAKIPENALIGTIIRGDQIIIPSGSDVIEAGDRMIIFSLRESIKEVEKLIA